jgi:hypothetical protein
VDAKSDSGPAALRAVHAGEGPGVLGKARNNGVHGRSIGAQGFAGVFGESTGGPGVSAHSNAVHGPLARSGKVWCKVDATGAPVEVGDMLTTSAVPGHAMRASDPARAFDAIIGKVLERLESARGLVPLLVAVH